VQKWLATVASFNRCDFWAETGSDWKHQQILSYWNSSHILKHLVYLKT